VEHKRSCKWTLVTAHNNREQPTPLSVADVASSAIGVFAANATSPGSWSATTAAVPNAPALRLIKIIPIDGTAGDRSTKLFSFDISWFDETTGLYFLADRSNAALDVVDTTGAFTGKPETLFGQIGANPAFQRGFAGDT
jgi:hypothetical protein